ncbi:MAG TPA: Crp/Fnr family transcriptional regulator [Flavisolibacter sp.]|nr:Crp/Fnr family transcriptional regulator [Flavisolibacter sp.]
MEKCLQEKVVAKNGFLVEAGKVCRHLYFLERGAVCGFYYLNGKRVTHWFAFENDFFTSFHSFITQQPAVENIQALEGSVMWAITKNDLTILLENFPEIERVLRLAYEKYYIRLEERFVNAQFKTAAERYEQLLQQTPHIAERVPLGYIASYLGVSQETLSRIRSRV